jgi:hypothetical protein
MNIKVNAESDTLGTLVIKFATNTSTLDQVVGKFNLNDTLEVHARDVTETLKLNETMDGLEALKKAVSTTSTMDSSVVPEISTPYVDTAGAISLIQDMAGKLTPSSFDSSATMATVNSLIATFNSQVRGLFPTFSGFTYTAILNSYLVPNVTFDPADISGSSSHSSNSQISAFYSNMIPTVSFYYHASQSIKALQQNVADVVASLRNINTAHIKPLDAATGPLLNNTNLFIALVTKVGSNVDTINNVLFPSLKQQIGNALQSTVFSVISALVSVLFGFDKIYCKNVVFPLTTMQDYACNGLR